jgi:hypothetical protein
MIGSIFTAPSSTEIDNLVKLATALGADKDTQKYLAALKAQADQAAAASEQVKKDQAAAIKRVAELSGKLLRCATAH